MEEQRYWRNIISREIKAEHDRVKKYYSQKGINSGGISSEEQTRLNIFLLCQSIAEKYNADIQPISKAEKPRVKKNPTPLAEKPIIEKLKDQPKEEVNDFQEINDFLEEEIATVQDSHPTTQNESSTLQNEFGELV